MAYKLGTSPIYTNSHAQDIYWIDGATTMPRLETDVLCLVYHHTAGVDSREWLAAPVNATYLVGAYPDTDDKPRIYKYMSERTAIPATQGYGKLGGLPYNPNRHSISIEVEGMGGGVPFRQDVLDAAAKLGASILKDWHDNRSRNLLVIGHDHLDAWTRKGRHSDPHYDWGRFVQQVYGYVGGLQGQVKGWGR